MGDQYLLMEGPKWYKEQMDKFWKYLNSIPDVGLLFMFQRITCHFLSGYLVDR